MISSSLFEWSERNEISPLAQAWANSSSERALLLEQPALRNSDIESREIELASNLPPASSVTRAVIVAAAFVESCWESIDEESEEKALCRGGLVPIGQGEYSFTTSENLGSKAMISRAIARDLAVEISTIEDIKDLF